MEARTFGVLSFFAAHLVYGAIVGGGYGRVAAEREPRRVPRAASLDLRQLGAARAALSSK